MLKTALVVPACEEGRGGGHLVRSAALVRSLRAAGSRAWLYRDRERVGTNALLDGDFTDTEKFIVEKEAIGGRSWDLIILDRFRTAKQELAFWQDIAPVLGIDEGVCRDDCDFLLDLLPGLSEKSPPNLLCPAFLPLPEQRRPSFHERSSPFRVLVLFGAEDAAGLTVPAALAFCPRENTALAVSAVFGPLNKHSAEGTIPLKNAGITVLSIKENSAMNIRETFSSYDLVLTHFGLAAFEALAARVPVVLISPGGYHERLARKAGFVSAGKGKQGIRRAASLLFSGGLPDKTKIRRIAETSEAAAKHWGVSERRDLGNFLASWTPLVYRACPACGSRENRPLARFPERTYRRCRNCGMVFMNRTVSPSREYNADYFFDDYKKQYGKTYLEDFPMLKENGKRRLSFISKLLERKPEHKETRRLLDIGCAYGPFLDAARETGFVPEGMDPAEDAVRYVQEQLGIPAVRGFFPADISLSASNPSGKYTVLTLWYVIEHLHDLRTALVKVNRLLVPGGVLAFSTPSFGGVSRRKSCKTFLENSPGDHQTIWEPGKCAGILEEFGFTVKKKVITGHHPERFPCIGRFLRRDGMAYRFFLVISRFFALGDTFEVYAVKTGDA